MTAKMTAKTSSKKTSGRGRRALALLLMAGTALGCSGEEDSLNAGSGETLVKEGDALITSRVDVARLAAVVRIAGHLTIRPADDMEVVNLPRLTAVEGSITVEDLPQRERPFRVELPALTRVGQNVAAQRSNTAVSFELPVLRTIGGHLAVEKAGTVNVRAELLTSINGDLRVLDGGMAALVLPRLARLGGSLRLDRFGPLVEKVPEAAAGDKPAAFVVSLPALTVIEGDVRLRSALELEIEAPLLARIAGDVLMNGLRVGLQLPALDVVAGELRISRVVLLASQLGALREVGGDLALLGTTLEPRGPLTLPALVTVGGALLVEEVGGMRELALPALTRVGGSLRLRANGDLQRFHLAAALELPSDLEVSGTGSTVVVAAPQLARLGGSLHFVDNGDLSVSLPRLQEVVGTLRVRRTTLRVLDLPGLQVVAQAVELDAVNGNGLDTLELAALRSIGTSLSLVHSQVFRSLSLPALARVGGIYQGHPLGSVLVTDNMALGALLLPALREVVQDMVIRRNPALDSSVVVPMAAEAMVGGKRDICGNLGDLPACS
jgi:hypothetical protein